MEVIKDTIKNVIEGLKERQKGLDKNDPGVLLKKILTKKESGHIKCNYFNKGVLDVSVDSSVVLYQLSLQKEGLLAKLNNKSEVVKNIRFHLGDVR